MPPPQAGTETKAELFRRLPSVDEVLKTDAFGLLVDVYGRTGVSDALRAALEALRGAIADGSCEADALKPALDALDGTVEDRLRRATACSLRPVINAAGVVIHTNLGRAPLAAEALRRVVACAAGYSNLEMDLATGERGCRDDHARHLLRQLFERNAIHGASAIVVNNNAAAVFLALSALTRGGEVVVSRGELVEIGGSFRVPDIMAESGAVLREVGTTNRTRIGDYVQAMGENTKALLRVHRSNFEIVGFTERPPLADLVALGRSRGVPVIEDLGSGALADMDAFGVPGEPGLFSSLRAGVSLVMCSGDKLLGGPQAGLIAGDPDLVARVRAHPLFRALRVDKMRYAALEATLACYLQERPRDVPLLAMLALPVSRIEERCRVLAQAATGFSAEVVACRTMIGGGAAPGKSLPSFAVALADRRSGAKALADRLRRQTVPIVARIEDERVLLDLRTVDETDDAYLAETVAGMAL